jgi:hypothetical protein
VLSGRDYGPAADVFSFGFVIWAVVTEKNPYENGRLVFERMKLGGGAGLISLPGLEGDFGSIAAACWAKDAAARPSARELVQLLAQ